MYCQQTFAALLYYYELRTRRLCKLITGIYTYHRWEQCTRVCVPAPPCWWRNVWQSSLGVHGTQHSPFQSPPPLVGRRWRQCEGQAALTSKCSAEDANSLLILTWWHHGALISLTLRFTLDLQLTILFIITTAEEIRIQRNRVVTGCQLVKGISSMV